MSGQIFGVIALAQVIEAPVFPVQKKGAWPVGLCGDTASAGSLLQKGVQKFHAVHIAAAVAQLHGRVEDIVVKKSSRKDPGLIIDISCEKMKGLLPGAAGGVAGDTDSCILRKKERMAFVKIRQRSLPLPLFSFIKGVGSHVAVMDLSAGIRVAVQYLPILHTAL